MRLIDANALLPTAVTVAIGKGLFMESRIVYFDEIEAAPTVDPVKHGRWIMRGGKRYCSDCGKRACVTRDTEDFWYTVGTDYCPTCGVKMDLEAE